MDKDYMDGKIGIAPAVLEEIRSLARKNRVQKVVLFGSRARGDFHRASDIDLAVLGGDLTNFALELEDTTSTLLTYDVVDLGVPLQREFLNAIRQEGIILYEEV